MASKHCRWAQVSARQGTESRIFTSCGAEHVSRPGPALPAPGAPAGAGGAPATHRADERHPHAGGGDLAVGVQAQLLLDCGAGRLLSAGPGRGDFCSPTCARGPRSALRGGLRPAGLFWEGPGHTQPPGLLAVPVNSDAHQPAGPAGPAV